jgi:cation transport protein ChaC
MDHNQLDESLKLLNGLHENLSKRNEIIKYIKENKQISIFAYGSLLWNPIEHINQIVPDCFLHNYKKGFFCEDFVYRGTKDSKGLTLGLEKDSNGIVHGALFISNNDKIIPFIKSFVKRETPSDFNKTLMDIYTYDFVQISLPGRANVEYALTCVVNKNSSFYLNNKLTLEEQAIRIGQAYGINGTNFQYLDKLINIYRQLNIQDSFSSDFQDLYNKVVLYRQSLSINIQKWFQIYDQLQTLEQRKEAAKKEHSIEFPSTIQPFLYSSIYFEETNKQSRQLTSL